jgi:hypothetical protein
VNLHQGNQTSSNLEDREGRLILVFSAFQLLLHLGYFVVQTDPRMLMPHAVAFLHDLLLIFAVFFGFAVASRVFPAPLRPTLKIMAIICLFGLGLLLASYPHFLREYLAFPVNIIGTDLGSARVFLKEYAGVAALWPIAFAVVAGSIALVVPLRVHLSARMYMVGGLVLGLVAVLTLPRLSPQPFVYSLQKEFVSRLGRDGRAVPPLKRPMSGSDGLIPSVSSALDLAKSFRADHVLLIVLEGITAQAFENEFMAQRDGFYARVKARAAFFSQYYATNLDSYPSLIAMLTSVQVPYLAYADESLYGAVNNAPNLTRTLRAKGFRTLFISTYAHQPFVPTRNDWDRVMDRGDLGSLDGWVSLGSSRMEAATEDRAALPAIFEFMAASKRSFVVHELVYGHSPEWRAVTGNRQLAYYDLYLNDIFDHLLANGLDSRTLMVIVSDHGDRAKASSIENYRVPLLVVGNDVCPFKDDGFRSHLDMQAIVAHYLTGTALPSAREELFVVGSSERWVYGQISREGEHVFLDDRTGRILSQRGNRDPLQVYRLFQATVDKFGSSYGK